jgi:hypothetical protein
MQALLRFLDLVRRELGADDVRAEIGGRDPGGDAVWATTPGGIRVVAVFDAAPPDVDEKRAKLRTLVDSFASLGSIEEAAQAPPPRAGVGHELDEALDLLARRARAVAAIVIDDGSPVMWGSSLVPHGVEDVDEAIWVARAAAAAEAAGFDLQELVTEEPDVARARLAEREAVSSGVAQLVRDLDRLRRLGARALDRAHVLAMQAIAAVREAEGKSQVNPVVPGMHVLVRPFATIYRLILVFDGAFSELHAEAALIRAMPVIERLVLALPPRDPAGTGAKVAVLRRLRRV